LGVRGGLIKSNRAEACIKILKGRGKPGKTQAKRRKERKQPYVLTDPGAEKFVTSNIRKPQREEVA